MEEHQRDHIIAKPTNRSCYFIQSSNPLRSLRRKKNLSKPNFEKLKAVRTGEGEGAEKSLIYDMLMTRKHSYKILIEGLDKENQTGASGILKDIKDPELSSPARNPVGVTMATPPSFVDFKSFKIGSKECKISAIVKSFEKSEIKNIMTDDWQKLARYLDTPSDRKLKLQRRLRYEDIDHFELVTDLLQDWKNREDGVTLGDLMEMLNEMEWNSFANDLKNQFGGDG